MIDAQDIIRYYKGVIPRPKPRVPHPLTPFTLSNSATGIGDTVMLTDLPRVAAAQGEQVTVFSTSPFFKTLMSFNPEYCEGITPFLVAADVLIEQYDLGNGHYIQRLQRAFGFDVENKPRGNLVVKDAKTVRNRVALHFEPGPHSAWQRLNIHPQARVLSVEAKSVVQKFVNTHGELDFIELGRVGHGWKGVRNITGIPLEQTIQEIARCEYFIGIMSGPLHIAAALEVKIITIVNFPRAELIYLPTLVDSGQVEGEWFYPQAVVLHQEGEGRLVPKLSLRNLERAFNGEIYPYWSEKYLPLVHEVF